MQQSKVVTDDPYLLLVAHAREARNFVFVDCQDLWLLFLESDMAAAHIMPPTMHARRA